MNLLRDLDTLDRREFFVFLLIFGVSCFSLISTGGIVYQNFFNFSCFLPQILLSSPKYAVGVGGFIFMAIIFQYLSLVKDKCFLKIISWIFLRVTFAMELLVGISYFKGINTEDESLKNVFFGNHTTQSWNFMQTELQCCVNSTNAQKELCGLNENDCLESLVGFYNGQNRILGEIAVLSLVVQVIALYLRICIRCNCSDQSTHEKQNGKYLPRHLLRYDEVSLKSNDNMSIGDARII